MTTETPQEDDRAAEAPSATERVIAQFGGVRPMAAKLEISASTIQGWKERDSIPEARRAEILAAAQKHEIVIDGADLGGAKPAADKQAVPEPPQAPTPPEPPKPSSAGSATAAPTPPVPPVPPTPPTSAAHHDRLNSRQARALTVAVIALGVGIAGLIRAVVDGQIEDGQTGASSALEERVAALEAQPAPQPVDLSGIDTRLSALETEVGSLPDGSASQQDLADQITALSNRVASLEQANPGDQVAALAQRVATLEQSAAGDQTASQVATLGQQVQSLSDTVTNLQATLSGLQEAQATLRAALQALPTAEMLNSTSNSIDQRLSAFQTQLDQAVALARQNNGEGPALVLAVSHLRDAVGSGQPYEAAFQSVDALAASDNTDGGALSQPLGVLSEHAAAGVPTFDMMAERFPDVADAIRAADRPEPEGWFDSALDSVGDLVTVRTAPGENDGDDADAITARAEARVAVADWSGVEQALSSLTGAPAAAAASWLADLQAKLAVDQALSTLQSDAVSALVGDQ